MKNSITVALTCLLISVWVAKATADSPRAQVRVFDSTVAPILARRCLDCHSGPEPKGKLNLSTNATAVRGGKHGQAIVAGKPDESLVWERVESDEMPPKEPLPEAEKSVLRNWIATGAVWGTDPIDPFQATTSRRAGRDWWSLQSIRRPILPTVQNSAWARGAIDAFVMQKLETAGLTPSNDAGKRQLLRRLSFDLLGLPPQPEEIDAFLNDDSPDAYERIVDHYLASPQYGVRWARWWLDLRGTARATGSSLTSSGPTRGAIATG